jgi:hypothetical protein
MEAVVTVPGPMNAAAMIRPVFPDFMRNLPQNMFL